MVGMNGWMQHGIVDGEPMYRLPWIDTGQGKPLSRVLEQLPKQYLAAIILDGYGHHSRLCKKCVCEITANCRDWHEWYSERGCKNEVVSADFRYLMSLQHGQLVRLIVTADCPAKLQARIPSLRFAEEKEQPSLEDVTE